VAPDPAAVHLAGALRAEGVQEREAQLCTAYELAGERQNALGLAAPVPATRRGYFDRPYQVIGADRFADALLAAVTDPGLRRLPLIGIVSQVLDSVDAAELPTRFVG
jgi:hypothetical protein